MPTLFEYASYNHFSTGCIVGPYLEYVDYVNWINFAGKYADMPRGDFTTVVPCLTRMLHGFVCMFVHLFIVVVLGMPVEWVGEKEFVTYKTIFHRILYYNVSMYGMRLMYYSPWCLSDASMIGCGLAYDGKENGKPSWEGIYNVKIIALETASSCIQMMAIWNHTVHLWLVRGVQHYS